MNPKQVTIKEIASRCGVSVSTVSRVLNDSPSVNPTKREKIQKVIDELGYQPSMFARAMVSKQTYTFAVVVSDITNPYFTSLVYEIEQYSKKVGYSVLLINTMSAGKNKDQASYEREIDNFKTIKEKQVDGVIVLGGELDRERIDEAYLQQLNKLDEEIPVVVIGHSHEGCQCTFIERDLDKGVRLLTQHLLALGYRKIGFIGGEPGIIITERRLKAFRETLSIYGQVDEDYIILNDYYIKDGYHAMRQLIAQDKELPTALVAINDDVAMGAIRALADAGLSCPQDIKIGSCDYFMNSEYHVPRITTIDQHNEYLGEVAVKKLLHFIDTNQEDIPFIHEPELMIRESCGVYLQEKDKCKDI